MCSHILHDSLCQLRKGNFTVFNYGYKFKTICDQLSVIGLDKNYGLLCAFFETLFITQLTIKRIERKTFEKLEQTLVQVKDYGIN